MTTRTKADRIRALLKAGLSPREIAGEVGCPTVYVYTVRDRTGEDGKPIQRPADKGCQARRTRRYREDKEFRERMLANLASWRKRNIEHARDLGRVYQRRRRARLKAQHMLAVAAEVV